MDSFIGSTVLFSKAERELELLFYDIVFAAVKCASEAINQCKYLGKVRISAKTKVFTFYWFFTVIASFVDWVKLSRSISWSKNVLLSQRRRELEPLCRQATMRIVAAKFFFRKEKTTKTSFSRYCISGVAS